MNAPEVIGDAWILVQGETVSLVEELALFDDTEYHADAVYPIEVP